MKTLGVLGWTDRSYGAEYSGIVLGRQIILDVSGCVPIQSSRGDLKRFDILLRPPIHFLAGAVQVAVVDAAQWHRELIADLLRQPAGWAKRCGQQIRRRKLPNGCDRHRAAICRKAMLLRQAGLSAAQSFQAFRRRSAKAAAAEAGERSTAKARRHPWTNHTRSDSSFEGSCMPPAMPLAVAQVHALLLAERSHDVATITGADSAVMASSETNLLKSTRCFAMPAAASI